MNIDEKQILNLERTINMKFPVSYAKFLANIPEGEVFEIEDTGICFYSISALTERNETYQIKEYDSDFFMIGQNGDRGYFINARDHTDEAIYSNDLGAIGSLKMGKEVDDIVTFMNKFK
jgi:hypothetical protein